MKTDPRIVTIRSRLLLSQTADDVRDVLAELDQIAHDVELGDAFAELAEDAFRVLRQVTTTRPHEAVAVLLEDLLPRCLHVPVQADKHRPPRFHALFARWLEDLPEDHRTTAREHALPIVIRSLDGASSGSALRLLREIGYWNGEVLKAIDRQIARHHDELGDHALSVRAWLTPAQGAPEWLLKELHRRIPGGPTLHRLTASHAIGTLDTAQLVWLHWIPLFAEPTPDAKSGMMLRLTVELLARLASGADPPELAARTWRWLRDVSGSTPSPSGVLLSGAIGPRFNIAGVVTDLLEGLAAQTEHQRYVHYLRLRECAQPEHMIGWTLGASRGALDKVVADATRPTGMAGNLATIESERKDASWDALLCCGDPSLSRSFADALVGETSGYVLGRLLGLGACLALTTLPRQIRDLVTGTASHTDWRDEEHLAAQIGAISAAHGAASQDAFSVLLAYRQIGRGVLLSAVTALADAARSSIRRNDRTVVGQLLEAAASADREDTRKAAAGAVASLVETGDLSHSELLEGASLASESGIESSARRALLFAFASLSGEQPSSLLGLARDLVDNKFVDNDGDSRSAALALVARQPDSRRDSRFLALQLGLLGTEGPLDVDPKSLTPLIAHILGGYFSVEPERFAPSVVTILTQGNSACVAQLLPSVRRVGSSNSTEVVDALVARLKRADAGGVAELLLIHALGDVSPEKLLGEGCLNSDSWMAAARMELANTLGRLQVSRHLDDTRLGVLLRLAGDGTYAVRRAAYRAAARCSPDRLAEVIREWTAWNQHGREGPRRLAAECAGWLDHGSDNNIRALRWDQEPAVREAYERSMSERDERERAMSYEQPVLAVASADAVVGAWRYGVALSQVGDDFTIDRLAERIRDDIPPSVRFWLARVRKAVEHRWSDVTRKWPEPWFARPGRLETFQGVLTGLGRNTQVVGTLWLVAAELPNGLSSWGGWGTTDGPIALDADRLQVSGRRVARVLVKSAEVFGGRVVFVGNGEYPDADSTI